ncbi:hypothetical protein BHE90_000916 [Fusarium euwallaceae]|uniref:Xylanolytic transcriptional activator regulatory domain-containing protein n=1 Tax=Fusarium euwallaceae TaxID=1147111 RepID=A0A430M979_9HYPO|nr:hypothetical protein BHE90_000916 [Fusarium euwallaceae]
MALDTLHFGIGECSLQVDRKELSAVSGFFAKVFDPGNQNEQFITGLDPEMFRLFLGWVKDRDVGSAAYRKEPWLSFTAHAWVLSTQIEAPEFGHFCLKAFMSNCALAPFGPWKYVQDYTPLDSPIRRFSNHYIAWNVSLLSGTPSEFDDLRAAALAAQAKGDIEDPRLYDCAHWYSPCGDRVDSVCEHSPEFMKEKNPRRPFTPIVPAPPAERGISLEVPGSRRGSQSARPPSSRLSSSRQNRHSRVSYELRPLSPDSSNSSISPKRRFWLRFASSLTHFTFLSTTMALCAVILPNESDGVRSGTRFYSIFCVSAGVLCSLLPKHGILVYMLLALGDAIGESTKEGIPSGIIPESSKAADPTEAPLTNPLALRTANWAPARHGNMLFMGTSSNWAFGRRVLTMAHETLTGEPLPIDNLLFDGHVYDLGWDGLKENCSQEEFDFSTLPAREFALYLINSVQFRCGTLFQLYDEDKFMRQFEQFHGNSDENEPMSPLWYVHYLILLAFGKAFVVQISKSASPPGSELFVQAMKMMPDLVLLDCCPIEKIQVLCSTALYLQCIFCRPAAHHVSQYLDEKYVQRCRLVWSTLYILERYMASLLGVPLMVAEEYISTPYPVCPRNKQRTATLEIQIKISKILSKIHLSVYGTEGQLDSRYLDATRSVLRSFSEIADQLNNSFAIGMNENASGISRISAHLQLQYHQCIVLTTRPLLYTFLQSRLGQADASLLDRLKSESVRRLVQICLESSYRIIKILSVLLGQGLLENFLPFDLDAAFTSTIAIIMAATIDASLVTDYNHWIQKSYAVLDEISSRGNTVALHIGSELRQLEDTLDHLRMREGWLTMSFAVGGNSLDTTQDGTEIPMPPPEGALGTGFLGESPMNFGLSPGQLLELANSLDIDSFLVPMASPDDAQL